MADKLVIGCGYLGRLVAACWHQEGHRVWATTRVVSHATSPRHGNSARSSNAQRRPLAGPDIKMGILQRIHTLADRVPTTPEYAPWKTSLTELKQLWLRSR